MSDTVRTVAVDEWVDEATAARAAGFTWFDSVTGVDEVGRLGPDGVDHLRVVVRLVRHATGRPEGLRLQCLVPRDAPQLPSLRGVFAGASWHEREVHDQVGVRFVAADGTSDERPVQWHQPAGVSPVWPLRKDAVLAARTAQPWPGTKEPGEGAGSRRRMAPAGVPDPATWGDRDASASVPAAAEVAAEVSGARVRRRR